MSTTLFIAIIVWVLGFFFIFTYLIGKDEDPRSMAQLTAVSILWPLAMVGFVVILFVGELIKLAGRR